MPRAPDFYLEFMLQHYEWEILPDGRPSGWLIYQEKTDNTELAALAYAVATHFSADLLGSRDIRFRPNAKAKKALRRRDRAST